MKKNTGRSTPAMRLRRGTAVAIAALFANGALMAQAAPETAPTEKEAADLTTAADLKANAKTKEADTTLETIRIVGTRKSIASAIGRKREAGTVTDSIVAEDIGQFPDKNVGEALSRITGVQLSREFGEGSQVSIRGVEPDLNRIEINGASVLGTGGGGGRGAELRELASELIASIDVVKGSTADLTEGGIGGTVQITTRKPFDFKERTIATTISGESASSRGGVQPRASLLLADKFFDGRLGLMGNFVYDNVLTRNDYARNTSWNLLRDWDFAADKTLTSMDPAVAAVNARTGCTAAAGLSANQITDCNRQWFDYAPRISRYGIWTRDHKRSSAELTAQFKINDALNVYSSYQANTQAQRLNDRNYGTDLIATTRLSTPGTAPVYNMATGVPSRAGTCTAIGANTTPAGMVVNKHHVDEYVVGGCNFVAGAGGQGAFSTAARDFELDIKSKYATAGFNYKGQGLSIDGMLVDSSSKYSSESNSVILTQNAPGLKVSLDSQRLPSFTFPAGSDPESASSYVQAQLQYRPSETDNKEKQAKLDLKYDLDKGIFSKLWVGVQARDASSEQYNGGGYLASNGANLGSSADDVAVLGANINQTLVYDPFFTGTAQRAPDAQGFINSNFSTRYIDAAGMAALVQTVRERSPGKFFDGYSGVSGLPSSWMAPSYKDAKVFFDTSNFNHGNVREAKGSDGLLYPQLPAFKVEEKIKSAYLRMDFDAELFGSEISGNFGGRYTETHDTSTGSYSYRVRRAASNAAGYSDFVVSNSIVSVDNKYSDFLPSFNAATWLMPNKLVARVGLAKVMARPAINLLAPNATCTEGSNSPQFNGDGSADDCTAGNPDLEPYRATKTDFSLEYYPGRDSQLSLALFQNDIDTYVRNNVKRENVDLFGNGKLFDVTQPVNGRGATTRGLELTARTAFTFLPGWLGGFGGDVNYTRMDYEYSAGNELLNILDGTVLPYPGMSKNSYNLALWYDEGQFNGRIAYNYRDAYYTGGNDVSGNPNFTDKTGYLDAKIQYRMSKNFTFSLEGKNLTDQAQTTYSGDLYRVNELAFSGRRYFASVSYKY
ncbi:TonB-dependent receptor [Roseateles oligotrophus]|uniref:TonB-dependent receptor n=1 Tax=Roseateles oligotrophus TaxID=1769250 RepID=A0ABT2YAC0_9BURK|nr:TonB-dependent receptor [Roseateles oligotrophus]MCV2367254.1 TonB-dependent receptor [Roseateles oligotrophus]